MQDRYRLLIVGGILILVGLSRLAWGHRPEVAAICFVVGVFAISAHFWTARNRPDA